MIVSSSRTNPELKALRLLRDQLLAWFVEMAEPQLRQGLKFTNPRASRDEVERLARTRAMSFFAGLVCTFESPSLAGLREVKERMDRYLRPSGALARRKAKDDEDWARRLAG